ncbi:MAG: phosphatidylserine/phosphatidylglycerophosphate/cardiolipin synthase family protein [Marinobacter excellens HL-55]|uniref:phospholipase D n=1 Tax=Marinobacter excellens HL-55 TaxID=1305731 RepID=A0A0P7Z5A3_9GAMM|nr:MAG: phosphatidylserine/phosphatidylglycerophosphate/cardiolipin synthase family protein [Marinobacter excellens HL-55]
MTMKLLAFALLLILAGIGLWHSFKPLPTGIRHQGEPVPLVAPKLLTDVTHHTDDGSTVLEHQIFDEIFRLIAQAEKFILVDMFLFNGTKPENTELRPLAEQLTQALLERKATRPDIDIVVISDPLNTFYGGTRSSEFEALSSAGIEVVITRLEPLRDSNPAWSSLWRLCCQWLGNNPDGGWLPNALGDEPATIRSYLALPNFKANHRKLLVTDDGQGYRAVITSANPHDGSSQHSNIGLAFGGPAVIDVVRSEQAALKMSGASTATLDHWISKMPADDQAGNDASGIMKVLTESAIRDAALDMIDRSQPGEALDMAMFYLSHRPIIKALSAAHQRGVSIRLLLDANKDAFGHEKNGIPNRPVAHELQQAGIPVRWCLTEGEQCHSKLLIYTPRDDQQELLLGSANFTRRNLDDLNLETNVWLATQASSAVAQQATTLFNQYWQAGPNHDQAMSLPYSAWAEPSRLRYWQYRIMEATGLSTF